MDTIVLTGSQGNLAVPHLFDNDAERDAFIERQEDGGIFCAAYDLGKPVYTTEGVGNLSTSTLSKPGLRVYDDPDHPRYGPVRRMHLVLLAMLADVKGWEDMLNEAIGEEWTVAMIEELAERSESAAQRFILTHAASLEN
ncbi:hypothetical protein [Erythrobacter aureus]|uniref:Uncharacterized protein n=1 Tax=Erythrobacter aureus TaxID=2182384 RepID=A0A345YIX5_9SPHN|nr:hypothetical protein [Erythrobacter aureus]AXK43877.1 hypothetical protein DVR09_15595 [Erythrobacter aureus]